ncbi:hypothetical protein V5O48_013029 [Marasmius crinis-equi]|uniref:Uncharacterized protein n=1 Tax=Marasmius crinis-equi TaxID=585013 RepID=A0ABR3F162_9AGAR
MANPSYFANSHGLVIGDDGNFATVHGNQILNYFNREPERKTALTIYDEGDIHRTKDLGVSTYPRRWDDGHRYSWEEGRQCLRANKTFCAAQVIGGEGRVFTVITYTGPEARQAFEKDFQMFSTSITAGPFQVYGINTNVPTVLFYDERQPLAKFWGSLGYWGRSYMEALIIQLNCNENEIWLDPRKGELCQGPAGPECDTILACYYIPRKNLPCSAELLQEGNCLSFLASLKARDIDRVVVRLIAEGFSRGNSKAEVHQPAICSASTNATVAVSGGLWRQDLVGDCLGAREVMKNGMTRFMLKGKGDRLSLWIEEEEGVWMSQVLSVFHARGIALDDDLKLIFPLLFLTGHLSTSETTRQRRREKSIYLFLHPVSPSTPTTRCKTSSLHYWSFDPTGQHPLPPKICEDLGLPIKLDLNVSLFIRYHWNNEAYKRMHQYQVARGFNPKTTDFAQHLGFPIYQVQSDFDRFEDADGQSPPAVSTSSSLGDLGENPYQPNTQLPPFQHAVSTPFNNPLPHPGASASAPSTASHTSSADSTYPNNSIHPGAVTTASPVQHSLAAVTSLVTTEGSTRVKGELEIAVPISEPIVDLSTTRPRMISKKANGTLPKKEPNPLLGNRRNINGKAVKDEEGTSAGRRKPPRTTQDEPAKEVLKSRETAVRANVNSQSPPKATSTSPNPCVSPRTPRNPASRLPTKSTPSASISPPNRPQIQAQESTRVHGTITRDATKPGMTSGKATPRSSRTQTPLPSEPIHLASSSPESRTPRSDAIIPASSPSAKPSSSVAHISRPRAGPSPALNAGTPACQLRNGSGMGGDERAKAPSKGAQQRRNPSTPTPTPTPARPTNVHERSSNSPRVWK